MDLEKLISQGSPREIRKYISQGESETLDPSLTVKGQKCPSMR